MLSEALDDTPTGKSTVKAKTDDRYRDLPSCQGLESGVVFIVSEDRVEAFSGEQIVGQEAKRSFILNDQRDWLRRTYHITAL
nr:hypothetical protein [Paracraurococcus ruber]